MSYDGTRILFSDRPGGTEHYHLYELDLASSGKARMTADKSGAQPEAIRQSPFASTTDPGYQAILGMMVAARNSLRTTARALIRQTSNRAPTGSGK